MNEGRKSYHDRFDCLKVAYEKPGRKHIDAIEEILSRCRFYILNFESWSIVDTTLTKLFEVLEYYESCTHVNLSNIRSICIQDF